MGIQAMELFNFYLATAVGFATQASSIFNLFITVMFSSFAFAAALPMRNIGRPKIIFNNHFSKSSMWVGFSLLSFYVISFISFQQCSRKAEEMFEVIKLYSESRKLPEAVQAVFETNQYFAPGWGLPSFGYIIGSAIGLGIFMWVTNVDRSDYNPNKAVQQTTKDVAAD